uniref:Uncharacterized protein n=1 Tax=Myotis myotis TaxID=51298 RepID=A0A7J7ZWW6_MYOMY|nr:hypothetical protein mMyoMyo1_009595 [Myotis myotis]
MYEAHCAAHSEWTARTLCGLQLSDAVLWSQWQRVSPGRRKAGPRPQAECQSRVRAARWVYLCQEDVVHAHEGSLVGWGPRMTTAQNRAAATLHGWAGGLRPGGHVLAGNTPWLLAVRQGLPGAVSGLGLLLGAVGNLGEMLGLGTQQVLRKRWAPSGLGVSAHRPDLPPPRLRDRLPRL